MQRLHSVSRSVQFISYAAPVHPPTISPQAHPRGPSTEDSKSTPGTSANGASASPDAPSDHGSNHDYDGTTAAPTPSSHPWIHDLELMHHFTAYAYLTMPGHEATKQVWGYSVPQEAFRFPFLMHSILAGTSESAKSCSFQVVIWNSSHGCCNSTQQQSSHIGPGKLPCYLRSCFNDRH